MNTIKLALALAVGGAAITVSAPASAVITTFADYSGVGGANMYWQRTGTTYLTATQIATAANPRRPGETVAAYNTRIAGLAATPTYVNASAASGATARATAGGTLFTIATPTSTTPGTVGAKFAFLSPSPASPLHYLSALGTLSASYTFFGTAAPGNPAQSFTLPGIGTYDAQAITTGSFSFIYNGTADLHVNNTTYHTGANLLTATFGNAAIVGKNRATSGSVSDSTSDGGTITYTSDFLSFIQTNDKDFSIEGTSITPALGFTANQALNTFKATTTGSFSTDPAPLVIAVPEPGVWALMIAGFGLVGVSARRRARVVAA